MLFIINFINVKIQKETHFFKLFFLQQKSKKSKVEKEASADEDENDPSSDDNSVSKPTIFSSVTVWYLKTP